MIREIIKSQAQPLASGSDYVQPMTFMEAEWPDGETGTVRFSQMEPPRFGNTHLPFDLWEKPLSQNPNVKVILVVRNPKDALVSYFHHMSSDGHHGEFTGTWNQYFELVQQGRLDWGDFFDFHVDWYKFCKGRKNSLILTFENMKRDHRSHVIKIAQFLGYNLPEDVVDHIVARSTVEQMQVDIREVFKGFTLWNPEKNFVRKGQVGDWVNYFTKEQSEYIDAKCRQYLDPLGLTFEYQL